MKTKKVISIGLAAMMSFTALTCSAATAYAEEKKDEVAGGKDVTISIMGRKVEIHDAMLEAADRYMELHPNVTVVMETVGGGDDYDGTLKTRLNGGNMPTIFTFMKFFQVFYNPACKRKFRILVTVCNNIKPVHNIRSC